MSQALLTTRFVRRRAAFSLMEVMVALGILAIGLSAIASLFPPAILMQKRTVDEVIAQQAANNALALVRGKQATQSEMATALGGDNSAFDMDAVVTPFPADWLDGTDPAGWTLNDRTYPAAETDVTSRSLSWAPLAIDMDTNATTYDIRLYVFVMQRESGQTWTQGAGTYANPGDDDEPSAGANAMPLVRRIDSVDVTGDAIRFEFDNTGKKRLNPGDAFLDEFGGIHRVQSADDNGVEVSGLIFHNDQGDNPSAIWIAEPADGEDRSPVRRVLGPLELNLSN